MPTQISDTSLAFKQVYGDVKQALAGMSDALKVGATHVYDVMIMQQRINALSRLCVILCLCLLPMLAWSAMYKRIAAAQTEPEKDTQRTWFGVCCVLPVIVGIIMLFMSFNLLLSAAINPEYGAIKDIIHMVKGMHPVIPKEN